MTRFVFTLLAPASLDDGMYKVRFPSQNEGNGIGEVRVVTTKPFNSPWRLIILGMYTIALRYCYSHEGLRKPKECG